MKTKLMRAASFALACSLSAGLIACGGTENPNTDTQLPDVSDATSSTETQDMSRVLELPDMDWGGREFRVLSAKSDTYDQFSNFEIYAESETGDLINDAVYRRNVDIESTYNVKIQEYPAPVEAFPDTFAVLKKSVMANEDLYDLVFLRQYELGPAAQEGYLYNLYDQPYINFEKAYWYKDVNDAYTINNKLFFTTSDFSLRDKNRVYIMVYNREMAEKYRLGDAVQLVRDGKWTIDVAAEWGKAVTNDLDGDGEYGINDSYGIGFDSGIGFAALIYGMDNHIIESDKDGNLKIVMNNEHLINSIDRAYTLANPPVGTYCEDWVGKVSFDPWETTSIMFSKQQLLFMTCFPASLAVRSATCDFDYGVLPFPKYDEEQEKYLTMSDNFCMAFGIPITTQTPDFSAFMLEVLSAKSEDVRYKYYEVACKVKYTYDEESAEMLDLIFSGITYDLGNIFDIGLLGILTSDLPFAGENKFSSLYAQKESAAKEKLNKVIEVFGD